MRPYKIMLREYIDQSGLSLREISRRCDERGTPVSQAYISKILNNENMPPPSEEVSRAIADVTGNDSEELILSGFLERAPKEIRDLFEKSTALNEAYELLEQLPKDMKEYRGKIPEDKLVEYLKRMDELGLKHNLGTFLFNPLKQFKQNKEYIEKQLEDLKLKPRDKITSAKIKDIEKGILSEAVKRLTNELTESEIIELTNDLYDLFNIRKNRMIESRIAIEGDD